MTDREIMQQALEALEALEEINKLSIGENAICLLAEIDGAMDALRERLAQPEQEPVAYAYTGIKNNGEYHGPHLVWRPEYMDAMSASMGAMAVPLYTAPPQRQWVGLTDQELKEMHNEIKVRLMGTYRTEDIYRSIEAKLREKNT